MALEVIKFSYLSEFINLPVYRSEDNTRIGKLVDLAALTTQVYPRITGLMVKFGFHQPAVYIPWSQVKRMVFKDHIAVEYPADGKFSYRASEKEILICKTFLDQQIISTEGYKIVRVNDIQLLIEDKAKESTNLWVVHLDIGIKGILRRLGFLKAVNTAFRWVTDRDIKDTFVSWKYVQPTTTESVYASVQLKTDASKLSEMHPADLADIFEDLGTEDRITLMESLDNFTAAQTLQEIRVKTRLQILESMEPYKLAPIINEMHIDEAVDLLDAVDTSKRHSIFSLLPSEKVAELKELSKLSMYSVGSIMNTDFITARQTESAGKVLKRISQECEKSEIYRYAYVLDKNDHLLGVVSLRSLLMCDEKLPMIDLMTELPVSVEIDTHIRTVARLFFKYNFEALPVVDDEKRMQGVISYRDAIASLYPEIKEEETV